MRPEDMILPGTKMVMFLLAFAAANAIWYLAFENSLELFRTDPNKRKWFKFAFVAGVTAAISCVTSGVEAMVTDFLIAFGCMWLGDVIDKS
jgi:hypothetical protein